MRKLCGGGVNAGGQSSLLQAWTRSRSSGCRACTGLLDRLWLEETPSEGESVHRATTGRPVNGGCFERPYPPRPSRRRQTSFVQTSSAVPVRPAGVGSDAVSGLSGTGAFRSRDRHSHRSPRSARSGRASAAPRFHLGAGLLPVGRSPSRLGRRPLAQGAPWPSLGSRPLE